MYSKFVPDGTAELSSLAKIYSSVHLCIWNKFLKLVCFLHAAIIPVVNNDVLNTGNTSVLVPTYVCIYVKIYRI